jgi:UDP-2,3-diacylglucosamine pyrophosphatase LpxH
MALPLTQNFHGLTSYNETNDLYIVSDLHLADGRIAPFGKFSHGENFFWDEAFGRFLDAIGSATNAPSQSLVINGDFLDFLRVDHVPSREDPADIARVQRWKDFLSMIGHPSAGNDLFLCDSNESTYGFKTNDYKSVWKLLLIAEGHPAFFNALGRFLTRGENRLIIVKGNHDLEFYWEPVRQALVFVLAGRNSDLVPVVNRRIRFFQDAVMINRELYIEHGHRFEPITWATPETLPGQPSELLLSVGSLFNRYVINKIEELDPLFDNIVPPTDVLKAVAIHAPSKLCRIIFTHVVGAWKIVRKDHYGFAARIVGKIFGLGLPVLVFAGLLGFLYINLSSTLPDGVVKWLLNVVASLLGALAVRWVQNTLMGAGSSPSLAADAEQLCRQNPDVKCVTLGHTHFSEMRECGAGNAWYINTGTWIPILEVKSNRVEDTNTFCVLRVRNDNGRLQREPLLKWNDTLGELEHLIMFDASK